MAEKSGRGSRGGPNTGDDVPPDRFAIKISVTPESVTKLLGDVPLDVGDRPHIEPNDDGSGTLYAFAPEVQIRELEAAGYAVEVGENVSETGRERMTEVASGDRYEGGRIPPSGLGTKSGPGPEKGRSGR